VEILAYLSISPKIKLQMVLFSCPLLFRKYVNLFSSFLKTDISNFPNEQESSPEYTHMYTYLNKMKVFFFIDVYAAQDGILNPRDGTQKDFCWNTIIPILNKI